jgi:thioredoxin-related protein
MKRLMYLLACFLPVLAGAAGTGVQFDDELSWAEIQAKAKAENRPIMLYMWSKGCGWCYQMNRYVLPNPKVGEFINSHFIAVKVTDDTPQSFDTPYFHRWHEDAVRIRKQYGLGNPDFVFFTPDGKLVHRTCGYKNPDPFINAVSGALDPELHSYTLLQKYKEGKTGPELLPRVANAANQHCNYENAKLAKKLSTEYAARVKNMSEAELFGDDRIRADNIRFAFVHFPAFKDIEGSKGRFFQYAYRHPEEVDRIVSGGSAALAAIKKIIAKEELDPVLWNLGKPVTPEPDWDALYKKVAGKYDDSYAKRVILDSQMDFYFRTHNWRKFVDARNHHIEAYPPDPFVHPAHDKLGVAAEKLIQNSYELLTASDDPEVLKAALGWLDKYQSLRSDRREMEPRAKVLHKLGRTQEAIACQEKAIALTIAEYQRDNRDSTVEVAAMSATLNKMKSGQPSWLPDT